ncbi:BRO-N domain-containing protein [Microbaculum marinisediminis]|uniref:Bro-N domain-containing protein n=1 Tax=Microbaculum marinisediminis TaxID=2931392 RepID=A0AAW5QVR0_9HYPH|nr:Bro-N domain-containing protein [Microbaculum sp. A6E488]MCT8972146.1 Bro-N domain-containing protein [Microbaculum sp. A6E488]
MQYALQVFEYENLDEFRIYDVNGEPWFVLIDVCRALDIKNSRDAASRLDDDEKGVTQTAPPEGRKNVRIINESGLYSLILRSDKPEAKRFKKWITSEVLPSIRRTGGYQLRPNTPSFIRRYNANWDRVDIGYFSVISELAIRVWGRLEQVGHVMADKAPDGTEIRPDVSVGKLFADWLRDEHPDHAYNFSYYRHWTPEGEFEARQYPNEIWPMFVHYVDTVWIPEHAERYFGARDVAALPHLPKLLPAPDKPKPGMMRARTVRRLRPTA